MDYFVANQIKSDYIREMAKDEPLHSLFLLGHTKEEVITAYKVTYIHMVKYHTLSQRDFEMEMIILRHLNRFFAHEVYMKMNGIAKKKSLDKNEQEELFEIDVESMQTPEGYDQVEEFVESIQKFDRDDQLYFQRAYTLAGIEYRPDYKISMERASRHIYSSEVSDTTKTFSNNKVIAQELSADENHVQHNKKDDNKERAAISNEPSRKEFNDTKIALLFIVIVTIIILYSLNR